VAVVGDDLDREPVRSVDARGSACPVPVIELARAVDEVDPGDRVEILSDDPTSKVDVPVWCRLRGHELIGRTPAEGGGWSFVVERAA
jgi:TusA-related sulfurtransferase